MKQSARSSSNAMAFSSARRARSSRSPSSSNGSSGSRVLPKKALSQHFLKSCVVRDEILRASGIGSDDVVVEIGAGTGALTEGLAEMAAQVLAVEVDRELANALLKTAESIPNLSVLCCDILELDLGQVAAEHGREKLVVVGNLPYHLTTRVILYLFEHRASIRQATIMVQKEYADRLLAWPGGRDYGAITLRTRYTAEADKVIDVPPSAFHPRPRVESTVLTLSFRSDPPVQVVDEGFLFRVIRVAFAQRRKMLVNTLSKLSGLAKEKVKRVCLSIDVDPNRRPETLSLEEFALLADALCTEK